MSAPARNLSVKPPWRQALLTSTAPTCLIKTLKIPLLRVCCYARRKKFSLDLHCHMVLNKLLAAYHWLPEELVLGVVLAEHKPRVTLQRPGRLNLQHNLVVLQTPLCGDRMRYEKFRHTAVKRLVHRVVLPRPRVGWTSRRAQFSWSLQWAVCTNMWHASLAVAPGETHTDLLWLSSPYTLIAWTKHSHTSHQWNYQKRLMFYPILHT